MPPPLSQVLALAVPLLPAACANSSASSGAAGAVSSRPAITAPRGSAGTLTKTPPLACPPEMALVGSFCIDHYEAHLVAMTGPGETEQPVSPFERPNKPVRYEARSSAGVPPQGYISRNEAAQACRNSGKRLCGAREWHQACGGSGATRYPYGPQEIHGRCNTGRPHVPTKLFGSIPLCSADLNSPRLNQEAGGLAKTGEYSGCVNDYGLFDMVGNLHEWVADESNSVLKNKIPIPYGQHRMGPRGSGVFLGGFFSSNSEHGHGCNYVTTHHAPDYHDYSTGFRCCAGPASQRH